MFIAILIIRSFSVIIYDRIIGTQNRTTSSCDHSAYIEAHYEQRSAHGIAATEARETKTRSKKAPGESAVLSILGRK